MNNLFSVPFAFNFNKNILFVCLFLISITSYADIVYRDISPDMGFSVTANSSQTSLIPLDINGDAVIEFDFSYTDNGNGIYNICIVPKINNEVLVNTLGYGIPLSSGQSITSNVVPLQVWGSTKAILTDNSVPNYANLGDCFIGLRIKNGADWNYGWVRVSVTANGVIIKDYGYESKPRYSCNTGQTPDDFMTVTPIQITSPAVNNNGINIVISYSDNLLICEKRKLTIMLKNNNTTVQGCTLTLPAITDFETQLITLNNNISKSNNTLFVNSINAGATQIIDLYYNVPCSKYGGTTNITFTNNFIIKSGTTTLFSPLLSVSSGYIAFSNGQTGYLNIPAVVGETVSKRFDFQNTGKAFNGSFRIKDEIQINNSNQNRYKVNGLRIESPIGTVIATVSSTALEQYLIGNTFEYVFDNLKLNTGQAFSVIEEVEPLECPNPNITSNVTFYYGCGSNFCQNPIGGGSYSTSISKNNKKADLKDDFTANESYESCLLSNGDNKIKKKIKLTNEGNAPATNIRYRIYAWGEENAAQWTFSKVSSIKITNPSNRVITHNSIYEDGRRNFSGTFDELRTGVADNEDNGVPYTRYYKPNCISDPDEIYWFYRKFEIDRLDPKEYIEIEFEEEFCCSQYNSSSTYAISTFRPQQDYVFSKRYLNGCEEVSESLSSPNPNSNDYIVQNTFTSNFDTYVKDLFGHRMGLAAPVSELNTQNTTEFIVSNSNKDFSFSNYKADKNKFLWEVTLVVDGDLIPSLKAGATGTSSSDLSGNIFFENLITGDRIFPDLANHPIQIIDSQTDDLFSFLQATVQYKDGNIPKLSQIGMNPLAVRVFFDIRNHNFGTINSPLKLNTANSDWNDGSSVQLMNNFIRDYNLHFSVTGVCGRASAAGEFQYNPDVITITSLIPSSDCMDCRMNLNTAAVNLRVNCPGCVTAGVLTFPTTFRRQTIGNNDLDNNGIQTTSQSGEVAIATPADYVFRNMTVHGSNDRIDLRTITEGDIMESHSGGSLWSPGAPGVGSYSGTSPSDLETKNGTNFLKYIARLDYFPGFLMPQMELLVDATHPIYVDYTQAGITYTYEITNKSILTPLDPSRGISAQKKFVQKGTANFLIQIPLEYLQTHQPYLKNDASKNLLPKLGTSFQFHTDDVFEITCYYYLQGNVSNPEFKANAEITTRCFYSGAPKDLNVPETDVTNPFNAFIISGRSATGLEWYSNYVCEASSGVFRVAEYTYQSHYYIERGHWVVCNRSLQHIYEYLDLDKNLYVSNDNFPFESRKLINFPQNLTLFIPHGYQSNRLLLNLTQNNVRYVTIDLEDSQFSRYIKRTSYTLSNVNGILIEVDKTLPQLVDYLSNINEDIKIVLQTNIYQDCPNNLTYGFRSEQHKNEYNWLEPAVNRFLLNYSDLDFPLTRDSDGANILNESTYFDENQQTTYGAVDNTPNTTINTGSTIHTNSINNIIEFNLGLNVSIDKIGVVPQDFSKSYIKINTTTTNGGSLTANNIEYSNDNGSTWQLMIPLANNNSIFLVNGSFANYKYRLNASYTCNGSNVTDAIQIEYGYWCAPNVQVTSGKNNVLAPTPCFSATQSINFIPDPVGISLEDPTISQSGCIYTNRIVAKSLDNGNFSSFIFTADIPSGMEYVNGSSLVFLSTSAVTYVLNDPVITNNQIQFNLNLATLNNGNVLNYGGLNNLFTLQFNTRLIGVLGGNTTIPVTMTPTSYCGSVLGTFSKTINNINNISFPLPTTSPINYTQNATATALTATPAAGSTLLWYGTNATGGTASTSAPIPSTTTVGTTTYYVSQRDGSGNESCRAAILVTVSSASVPKPTVTNISLCQGVTGTQLTATPSSGGTLKWYGMDATGGTFNTTAPTPSTTTFGTFTYYVSQTVGGVESDRAALTVTIKASPQFEIYQNAINSNNIVSGQTRYIDKITNLLVPNSFNKYTWSSGEIVNSISIDPTNVTALPNSGKTYSVIVGHNLNTCTTTKSVTVYAQPCGVSLNTQTGEASFLCPGGNVNFESTAWGVPNLSYKWYYKSQNTASYTQIPSEITNKYTANNVGFYKVEITDSRGCVNFKEAEVIDHIEITCPNTICPNTLPEIVITNANGVVGTYGTQWYDRDDTPITKGIATSDYYYGAAVTDLCTLSTKGIAGKCNIQVYEVPTPYHLISTERNNDDSPLFFCKSQVTTIQVDNKTANDAYINSISNYWSTGQSVLDDVVTVKGTKSYSITTVDNVTGCSVESNRIDIVNQEVKIIRTCDGNNGVRLTATSNFLVGDISYNWSFNGVAMVDGIGKASIVPTQVGTYTVEEVNGTHCPVESDCWGIYENLNTQESSSVELLDNNQRGFENISCVDFSVGSSSNPFETDYACLASPVSGTAATFGKFIINRLGLNAYDWNPNGPITLQNKGNTWINSRTNNNGNGSLLIDGTREHVAKKIWGKTFEVIHGNNYLFRFRVRDINVKSAIPPIKEMPELFIQITYQNALGNSFKYIAQHQSIYNSGIEPWIEFSSVTSAIPENIPNCVDLSEITVGKFEIFMKGGGVIGRDISIDDVSLIPFGICDNVPLSPRECKAGLAVLDVDPIIICNGQSTTLSFTNAPSNLQYSWTGNGTQTGTSYVTDMLSLSDITKSQKFDYYVTVIDPVASCTLNLKKTVMVAAPPSVSIDQIEVCEPNFKANFAGLGDDITYDWYVNGLKVLSQKHENVALNSLVAGDIIQCKVSNVWCDGGSEVLSNIIEYQPNVPKPIVVELVEYCEGVTATSLNATAMSNAVLVWYDINSTRGIPSSIATIPNTTSVGESTYYVSQKIGLCESERSGIKVIVSPVLVSNAGTNQTNVTGPQVNLSGSGSSIGTWSLESGPIVTGITYSPTATAENVTVDGLTELGLYKFLYTVSGAVPCVDAISSVTVDITTLIGVHEDLHISNLTVYPNPTITGELNFSRTVDAYSLMNSEGIVVMSGKESNRILVNDLPAGLYMLNLEGQLQKVVIEK